MWVGLVPVRTKRVSIPPRLPKRMSVLRRSPTMIILDLSSLFLHARGKADDRQLWHVTNTNYKQGLLCHDGVEHGRLGFADDDRLTPGAVNQRCRRRSAT